jgi:hypothetical protein
MIYTPLHCIASDTTDTIDQQNHLCIYMKIRTEASGRE